MGTIQKNHRVFLVGFVCRRAKQLGGSGNRFFAGDFWWIVFKQEKPFGGFTPFGKHWETDSCLALGGHIQVCASAYLCPCHGDVRFLKCLCLYRERRIVWISEININCGIFIVIKILHANLITINIMLLVRSLRLFSCNGSNI